MPQHCWPYFITMYCFTQQVLNEVDVLCRFRFRHFSQAGFVYLSVAYLEDLKAQWWSSFNAIKICECHGCFLHNGLAWKDGEGCCFCTNLPLLWLVQRSWIILEWRSNEPVLWLYLNWMVVTLWESFKYLQRISLEFTVTHSISGKKRERCFLFYPGFFSSGHRVSL